MRMPFPSSIWLGKYFRRVDQGMASGDELLKAGVRMPVPYGIDVAPDGEHLVQPAERAPHRSHRPRDPSRCEDDRHALQRAAPAALRLEGAALDPELLVRARLALRPRHARVPRATAADRAARQRDPLRAERAIASTDTSGSAAPTATRLIRFEPGGRSRRCAGERFHGLSAAHPGDLHPRARLRRAGARLDVELEPAQYGRSRAASRA